MSDSNLKVCYLNARSVHKHIDDMRNDFNLCCGDIAIFTETRFLSSDPDEMYMIDGYQMFRNGSSAFIANSRPFGGMVIYSKVPFVQGYPCIANTNGVELTIVRLDHDWRESFSTGFNPKFVYGIK